MGANAAAIQAMGRDVASYRAIAGQRIDTAGWSGGARVATPVALGGLAMRDFFDAAVGAHDVARGKPEPDLFLLAAARIGADPGEWFPASGVGMPRPGSAGLAEAARGEAEPLFERLRNERADGAPWRNFG